MRRTSLLLAALACLAPAATAQAQDIGVNVIDFTGRSAGNFDLMDLATTSAVPITQAECDANAEITFRFTGLDVTRTNLHFYQGASCDDVMIRNDTTDDRCAQLDIGPFTTEMRMQRDVTVPVTALVPCGEGGSGVITIWVLLVNNTMSDEVSGAGQSVSFPIAYDFEGPGAPSNFTARGGETSITLEWEGGSDQIIEYEVYVDPTGCADGTPSGPLVDDPENPPMSLLATTIDGPSSGGSVPFPDSVAIGGSAAVAVLPIDRSGNPGTLSQVVCVDRFEVTTWWEMYCGSGGSADACGGSGCSVASGRESPAPLALLLALGLGVFLLRRSRRCTAAVLALAALGAAKTARADIDDWTAVPTYQSSPEHFGLELRVGIFYPTGLGDSFTSADYFGGDIGPMLSFELHYFPWRLPYLGLVGVGAGLGWSQWDTNTPGGTQGDRNVFEMITMRPFLVWRIDTLARELNVPIVLTPKFGMDVVHWLTSVGGATEAEGWSVGIRAAGKVSLELDFLEPRAARQLDEEWGINHSEIFFELYYSGAGDAPGGMLPVSGWGWAAGLGFTF